MPRFSIIIPTYNRGPLLSHAVDSVLSQELDDYEIIVVDDGSTDDTAQRLARYGERVRYVRQGNRGAASAKNRGIQEAVGEIVGVLDSDDMWEPQMLTEVARAFDERPAAGLIAVGAREVRADGSRTDLCYGKRSRGALYSTRSLLWHDPGGCSWFFVRRELLARVDGFDESLRSAEECDLALRLSFETELAALRKPLLLRRKHGDNLSDDMELNARSWIQLLDKLRREHPLFVSRHPWVYRRALGKERLRLGRELLARASNDPGALSEARQQLWQGLLEYPWFVRGPLYWAWAWLAPTTFARWRRRELRARSRRGL